VLFLFFVAFFPSFFFVGILNGYIAVSAPKIFS
jgi:hypothetical protein